MKPFITAEDIVPLADFKARTSELFRQLKEGQRPLIITQNGKPAAVIITPEDFDRLQERERFVESVASGLEDSEAGRLVEDEALEQELNEEFDASS